MSDNALKLLNYLDNNGKQTQKQLITRTKLPTRVVRYSIAQLLERGYVRRIPNLHDMRSIFYQISPEIVNISAIENYEIQQPIESNSSN